MHRVREVLLCFEQCGSLLMTSQLSSGRRWCQNGQEDEESSAYYTGTATAASLGSHEYIDNCLPRLMCAPISYLTPLDGLTTGPCQAAVRFHYCAQRPVTLLCWRRVFCLLRRAAHAHQRYCCALFRPPLWMGWRVIGERQWKHFWWQEMIQSLEKQQERMEGWHACYSSIAPQVACKSNSC